MESLSSRQVSLSSRQVWRRQIAEETRRDRTMSEYVRIKYPKIYKESLNVYETMSNKYPNKHDIRKLPEFYQICHGHSTNPNMVQSDAGDKQFQDNMVLNIQLMQRQTTSQKQTTSTPQDATMVLNTTTSTPQDATTVLNTTTSTPQDATTVLNTTTSTPQDATTVLNTTTSTPQDATTVLNTTTSTPQDATTVLNTTTSTPQDATTVLNTTTSTPQDATTMLNTTMSTLQGSGAGDLQLDSLDQTVVDMIIEELQYDQDLNNFFENINVEHLSPLEAELLLY